MRRIEWRFILLFVGYFSLIGWWLWPDYVHLLVWFLGGILSLGFEYIDRLWFMYITKPHEPLSMAVKKLIAVHHYQAAWRLLKVRGNEQQTLMGKSVVFMVIFIPFGWYILSSTGSFLAMGLVLGIGLSLLYEVARDWQRKPYLKKKIFWPVKRVISDKELYVVVGLFAISFGWFTVAMLR